MRKMLLIVGALLVVLVFTVFAAPLEVWKLVDGQWVSIGSANSTNLEADAWAFSIGGKDGKCNKRVWTINAEVEVQVAQWIDFYITGTKWSWYVRKPGTYLTDCITAQIKSNGEVDVSFSGFASPTYLPNQGTDTVKNYIDAWFGFGADSGAAQFKPAAEMDGFSFRIPDSAQLHQGLQTKLWNKIYVVECNSASTYKTTGTITLTLVRIKPWIDPDTGKFRPLSDYNYEELPPQ